MDRAHLIPISVVGIPNAGRYKVGLLCPECGEQSFEPLARLHQRHKMICRHCWRRISLGDEPNRVFIQQTIRFCETRAARRRAGQPSLYIQAFLHSGEGPAVLENKDALRPPPWLASGEA